MLPMKKLMLNSLVFIAFCNFCFAGPDYTQPFTTDTLPKVNISQNPWDLPSANNQSRKLMMSPNPNAKFAVYKPAVKNPPAPVGKLCCIPPNTNLELWFGNKVARMGSNLTYDVVKNGPDKITFPHAVVGAATQSYYVAILDMDSQDQHWLFSYSGYKLINKLRPPLEAGTSNLDWEAPIFKAEKTHRIMAAVFKPKTNVIDFKVPTRSGATTTLQTKYESDPTYFITEKPISAIWFFVYKPSDSKGCSQNQQKCKDEFGINGACDTNLLCQSNTGKQVCLVSNTGNYLNDGALCECTQVGKEDYNGYCKNDQCEISEGISCYEECIDCVPCKDETYEKKRCRCKSDFAKIGACDNAKVCKIGTTQCDG